METSSRRLNRAWIGVFAALLLLAVALPIITAQRAPAQTVDPTRTIGMDVTNTAPASGACPPTTTGLGAGRSSTSGTLHEAAAGRTTDFYVCLWNTSPGNSNPNSFKIFAPQGFTVTAASIHSMSSSKATVRRVDNNTAVTVTGLDALRNAPGQFLVVKITATVSSPTTRPTTVSWNATGYTGSNLTGNTFTVVVGDPTTTIVDARLCGGDSYTENTTGGSGDTPNNAVASLTITNNSGEPCFSVEVTHTTNDDGGAWSLIKSTEGIIVNGTLEIDWEIPGTGPVKWTQVSWGVPDTANFVDFHDVQRCNLPDATPTWEEQFPGSEEMCLLVSNLRQVNSKWMQYEKIAVSADLGVRKG